MGKVSFFRETDREASFLRRLKRKKNK